MPAARITTCRKPTSIAVASMSSRKRVLTPRPRLFESEGRSDSIMAHKRRPSSPAKTPAKGSSKSRSGRSVSRSRRAATQRDVIPKPSIGDSVFRSPTPKFFVAHCCFNWDPRSLKSVADSLTACAPQSRIPPDRSSQACAFLPRPPTCLDVHDTRHSLPKQPCATGHPATSCNGKA